MQKGATLLELAVTIAVAAVVFFILGSIFLAQGRFLAIEDAISETQLHAFAAGDAVGLYASSARAVVASRTVNGTGYASATSTVVLELPAIDADGNVIASEYDYAAIGTDPEDPSLFMTDVEPSANSARAGGKHTRAQLVDKVIFRYNTVDPASATVLDLYVRTARTIRGRTIAMPFGKSYFLGSS
jgi:hypothetical protein